MRSKVVFSFLFSFTHQFFAVCLLLFIYFIFETYSLSVFSKFLSLQIKKKTHTKSEKKRQNKNICNMFLQTEGLLHFEFFLFVFISRKNFFFFCSSLRFACSLFLFSFIALVQSKLEYGFRYLDAIIYKCLTISLLSLSFSRVYHTRRHC